MLERPRYVAGGPAEEPVIASAPILTSLPNLDVVRFDAQGLVPALVQDALTDQVLMLAYMNRETLELTLTTGEAHFWSRSRSEIWRKGATSGNTQQVVEVWLDCDADAVLLRVRPAGPACHTGQFSCFFQQLSPHADAIEVY